MNLGRREAGCRRAIDGVGASICMLMMKKETRSGKAVGEMRHGLLERELV